MSKSEFYYSKTDGKNTQSVVTASDADVVYGVGATRRQARVAEWPAVQKLQSRRGL